MFTRLRIKNFKAWGEQLWRDGVELAPITLLLGTNSAGKTSILQPLLLLQQTFGSPDRSQDLYLGGKRGDLVDLGTWEQIVHGHDPRAELGFGLGLADVDPHLVQRDEETAGSPTPPERGELTYEALYHYRTGALHLHKLRYAHLGWDLSVERSPKGAYHLRTSRGGKAEGRSLTPKRDFKPERSVTLPHSADDALAFDGWVAEHHSFALSRAVENVRYLGPLRERPQPTYLWGGQEPGQIGSRGEDAIAALLASLNAAKKADRGKLVAEVSRWLAAMGVADKLELEQVGNSRFYEVTLSTAGKKANLIHVGFGVSQVLPMIVLALTAPEGCTVIAEQPEIHLHPRAQTELANLLVETAKNRRIQFLIETHSEHLFRRLQYLIADEQLAAEQCRLYFIDRQPGGEPRLDRLVPDEFGHIRNWPDHFFGDAIGEVERQADRRIAREFGGSSGG